MRHPFWIWTQSASWLCIGLSGCLHGQDWRAAVSKPLTRPVADRRESLPQPKVIGPLRKEKTPFVPPTSIPTPTVVASPPARAFVPGVSGPRPSPSKVGATPVGHVTPSAITARPAALTASGMDRTSRLPAEAIQTPTTQDEAQPRRMKVLEADFIPLPAPPASPLPVETPRGSEFLSRDHQGAVPSSDRSALPDGRGSSVSQSPAREVFAEFERQIPLRKTGVTPESAAPAHDDEIVVAPEREPTTPRPLPLIIPARTSAASIPPVVPRSLPPVSAKELPDVTDTITTASDSPHSDSPHMDLDRIARPRDVAILVEQVFEDLRQRRLDQARQRTARLKQIVTRRESALEETLAAKQAGVSAEPQRLRADPHAVPVNKVPSEKLLDDEEFKNRP